MSYWTLRALMLVVPRVPLRVLAPAVWLAGGAAWYLSRRLRETTADHMRHVLGHRATPRTVQPAARDCVRSAAWYWVDLARASRMTPEQVFDCLDSVEGLDVLFDAYDAGEGVLLLSAHLGNPEFFAVLLPHIGLPIAIFVEPLGDPRAHGLIESTRERAGARMLRPDTAGLRAGHAMLRCGGVLGGLGDRDVLGSGRPYAFFGERASMPDGMVEMALRRGAAVVAAWVTRTRPGRYAARIERIPVPGFREDHRAMVPAAEYAYLASLERAIASAPGQWFALTPVWRGLQ